MSQLPGGAQNVAQGPAGLNVSVLGTSEAPKPKAASDASAGSSYKRVMDTRSKES